jgi:hypothetical protein
MSGKMARSWDQTSFGTTGTPEALRSPPMASREPPPSAIVYAVPEFIWGIPVELGHACQIQAHGFQYLNDD